MKNKKSFLTKEFKNVQALLFTLLIGFIAGVGGGNYFLSFDTTSSHSTSPNQTSHDSLTTSFLSPEKGVPLKTIQTENLKCTVCFTPGQECLPLIIKTLDDAKKSILMQAYSLTSKPIAEALIRAHNRGITITVIADKSQQRERYTQVRTLQAAGIPVYIDYTPAIAHNKVILIDDEIVISGSYNFSNAAEKRNAENVIFLENKEVQKLFCTNFNKRLQASKMLAE